MEISVRGNYLHYAIVAGVGPTGLTTSQLLDIILSSIEQHGPFCGIAADAFGTGSVARSRWHCLSIVARHILKAILPSILTPD